MAALAGSGAFFEPVVLQPSGGEGVSACRGCFFLQGVRLGVWTLIGFRSCSYGVVDLRLGLTVLRSFVFRHVRRYLFNMDFPKSLGICCWAGLSVSWHYGSPKPATQFLSDVVVGLGFRVPLRKTRASSRPGTPQHVIKSSA